MCAILTPSHGPSSTREPSHAAPAHAGRSTVARPHAPTAASPSRGQGVCPGPAHPPGRPRASRGPGAGPAPQGSREALSSSRASGRFTPPRTQGPKALAGGAGRGGSLPPGCRRDSPGGRGPLPHAAPRGEQDTHVPTVRRRLLAQLRPPRPTPASQPCATWKRKLHPKPRTRPAAVLRPAPSAPGTHHPHGRGALAAPSRTQPPLPCRRRRGK